MTETATIDQAALNQLFLDARTQNGWQDKPVADALLREAVDLAKMGPTSVNCSPMRLVFVRTPEGKERLRPALAETNVEKTMAAPATAIVAYDLAFFELLPRLFPAMDTKPWFANNEPFAKEAAFRNGTLQGGYLIMALRAVGLDCGPMSGFDNAKVDAEFFQGTTIRSNFLCNIGYGDIAKVYPRSPRLDFAEFAQIV